MDSSYNP